MDPEENVEHKRELANFLRGETNRLCDLVMLVFDTADESSLSFVRKIEAGMLDDDLPRVFVGIDAESEDSNNDDDSVQPTTVMDTAVIHCRELDLEPPITTSKEALYNSSEAGMAERMKALDHLSRCARLHEAGVDQLRSLPHEEQKRRDAARRRKLMWFGGLVSVSVVVAASVGLWLGATGNSKGERKDRFGWITKILFGAGIEQRTATA